MRNSVSKRGRRQTVPPLFPLNNIYFSRGNAARTAEQRKAKQSALSERKFIETIRSLLPAQRAAALREKGVKAQTVRASNPTTTKKTVLLTSQG